MFSNSNSCNVSIFTGNGISYISTSNNSGINTNNAVASDNSGSSSAGVRSGNGYLQVPSIPVTELIHRMALLSQTRDVSNSPEVFNKTVGSDNNRAQVSVTPAIISIQDSSGDTVTVIGTPEGAGSYLSVSQQSRQVNGVSDNVIAVNFSSNRASSAAPKILVNGELR